jgi:hypothetical protein
MVSWLKDNLSGSHCHTHSKVLPKRGSLDFLAGVLCALPSKVKRKLATGSLKGEQSSTTQIPSSLKSRRKGETRSLNVQNTTTKECTIAAGCYFFLIRLVVKKTTLPTSRVFLAEDCLGEKKLARCALSAILTPNFCALTCC